MRLHAAVSTFSGSAWADDATLLFLAVSECTLARLGSPHALR
jgi:hypothetical protein